MCFSLAESEWFSLTEITLLQSSAKLWIYCKSAHWAPGSWFETRLNQAHKAARGGTIKDANLSAELVKGGSCSEKWSGRFASSLIWEVWFEKFDLRSSGCLFIVIFILSHSSSAGHWNPALWSSACWQNVPAPAGPHFPHVLYKTMGKKIEKTPHFLSQLAKSPKAKTQL